jgi:hypothetical protein
VLPRGVAPGGGVVVNIVDQRSGGERPQVSEKRGPDGLRQIQVLIRDEMSRQTIRGEHDAAFGARYGLRPAVRPR